MLKRAFECKQNHIKLIIREQSSFKSVKEVEKEEYSSQITVLKNKIIEKEAFCKTEVC